MLKRVGESRKPCLTPTVVFDESFTLYAAIKVNCTGALVVEVLYDLHQVGVNVVKLCSRPNVFVPYLKAVLLIFEVPLTQYPEAENLFCCTTSCSKACQFFHADCFCLNFNLFNSTFCMTFVGWYIRLIVQ